MSLGMMNIPPAEKGNCCVGAWSWLRPAGNTSTSYHMRRSLSASIKYATDESEVIWLKAIIFTMAYSGRPKEEIKYLSVFLLIPY
jgi:hypothetical protein